jgi:CheY-like chemotaxis protein
MGEGGSMLAAVVREAVSQVAAPGVAEKILSAAKAEAGYQELPLDPVLFAEFCDGELRDVLVEMLGEDAADQVKSELDPILRQARSRGRINSGPAPRAQRIPGLELDLSLHRSSPAPPKPRSAPAPETPVPAPPRDVPQVPARAAVPAPGARPRSILIADDDQQLLQALAKGLIAEGFEVFTAADGQAAAQQVKELHPEVVVADLHMPAFGGRQLIKLLRHELGPDAPPVVIMTGNVFAPSNMHGAAAVLRKPLDIAELIAAIEQAHLDHASGI